MLAVIVSKGQLGTGKAPAQHWPVALQSPATLKWAAIFLAIFLAIHWQEVTSPTLNVDDWALLGEPIHQLDQSRPSWDVIYGLLFQQSFSPFFGWLLAAASIFAIAACLPLFQPALSPPWLALAALLISLHAYLLDLFNFSFAIGLYLLPAALSVWGGVLMAYKPAPPLLGRRWLDGVLGVAMVVFAMGIYQPNGVMGLGLIGFDALSRALGTARFRRQSGLTVLVGIVGGSLIYAVIAKLAMGNQVPNARSGFASPDRLVEKLFNADVYREIYATNVSLLWTPAQLLLSATFLLLLLVLSLVLWHRCADGAERVRRLGWLWFAALWLTLLPLFLYFVLQAGFPRRSLGLGNVGSVGFVILALVWLYGAGGPGGRWLRRGARALLGLLVVGYVIPQAAFASKVWERVHLLERRDMAMAQAIAADVRALSRANPAVPPQPFRLFGTTERTQPFPHWSSVGESVFRQGWSIEAIFRQLLRLQAQHIAYRSEGNEAQVRRTVPRCSAWPDPGSIVVHQGQWLVCLEANPAPSQASGGAPP